MPVLLPDQPLTSLDEYIDGFDGGQGLVRCRELGPDGTLDTIERSGLRAYDSATAWYYGRDDTRTYATGASNWGTLTLAAPLDPASGATHPPFGRRAQGLRRFGGPVPAAAGVRPADPAGR